MHSQPKYLTTDIGKNLWDKLQRYCEENLISKTSVIKLALTEYLNKKEEKKEG